MEAVYGFCHYVVVTIHEAFFPGEAHGTENLPASGGFIIAANHASFLDPPFVGSQVPRQMCFFARKTLWKKGFASWWLDTVEAIPVDRDAGSDVASVKRVLHALKQGKALILFPEGTRTRTGGLQSPKAGVGLLACRTGVTVVPARIFGTFEAFGRAGSLRPGTPVSVVFGQPLGPADYDEPAAGRERYQRASERIMAAIAALDLPQPVIV
ncbi:MAG: glycerol acyltransferase [Verrucomicrobia bacterium RIFCSPLOWO2_12_FULL_64_8]|nr:MAG: glycerol acyltransferase [Verrucomicrobia bacterium RIFCSPLOWO2_12_FULL_64_8]